MLILGPGLAGTFISVLQLFSEVFCLYFLSFSFEFFSNPKLYKTLAVKDTFIPEKLKPRLTFNSGLALIGFRTTGPR